MSNFFAVMWDVKPGTEDKIRELFANYGRPDHEVKNAEGEIVGRLLATQVFMKGSTVVRIIEFEGSIVDVAPHMGRQPAIRELEDALDNYVANPRDMSTADGARKFFMESAMETLAARRWDQ
jgi:cytidylate kinase